MSSVPVLILEGPGDKDAAPELVRRVSDYQVNPAPNPILKQSVPILNRPGKLEEMVGYALTRENADSVLILLDCDDDCPVEVAKSWVPRLRSLNPARKVGISLWMKEFEALFLVSAANIAAAHPRYNWVSTSWDGDAEAVRDAKGQLSHMMGPGHIYKPTLNQAQFVACLDHDAIATLRCFQHFQQCLAWLADDAAAPVFPALLEELA